VGELGGEDLDGHEALEPEIPGPVHDGHPAAADLVLDLVLVAQRGGDTVAQGVRGGGRGGHGLGYAVAGKFVSRCAAGARSQWYGCCLPINDGTRFNAGTPSNDNDGTRMTRIVRTRPDRFLSGSRSPNRRRLLSIHDVKVFGGAGERALRRTKPIRPCPG
jgi:hypothetical protein